MSLRHLGYLVLIGLASGCSQIRVEQPHLHRNTLVFDGEAIPYEVFVPAVRTSSEPLPMLLLLHGAGGNGDDMVRHWQLLGEAHGIVLVAPTLSLSAAQETQVPRLLPALLDAATASAGTAIDAKRIYAFGYSAGGYFAFDAATLLSTRFAAVAVFASFIAPDYVDIVAQARRKTPIALYVGDRDPFFSLAQTRGTRDLLAAHGFPVHYVELRGQDHAYALAAQRINEDVWQTMAQTVLP